MPVTDFQARVYECIVLIPEGKVTTYLDLSRALKTSPRAIGNALRNNPFAPEVPCHRVISANGYIGGFMGEWKKAPSGINQTKKRDLLKEEGVFFTDEGMLVESPDSWFNGPWEKKKSESTNSKLVKPAARRLR